MSSGRDEPPTGDAHTPATLLGVPLQSRWRSLPSDLQQLAYGLHAELGNVRSGAAWPIPMRKAQLTRTGGRCATDGTPLTFDPWAPHDHRCPTCGANWRGVPHDDWWSMGAQLWTAERALQAAVLGDMWQRPELSALARDAIVRVTERWPRYPNADNALGPTRPFFSTYLESVWLLNVCLAAHVLRHDARSRGAIDAFNSAVVEPSRALIASFPEGASNRQAWHTAAQLAAAVLLGDDAAIAPLVDGRLGVTALITRGLLDDGSWYEGENYHLFAHRGLWYGVTLLDSLGVELSPAMTHRFDAGFRTPLLGVLPDGTFPSRKDSRYAVSVHQWRFAEWCELGLVRTGDPVLATWLERLYGSDLCLGDTGRARSTADIERDERPVQLSRADLGWRTLLFARAMPWAQAAGGYDQSVVLSSQGLNVLRADSGRIYASLEGGVTGGGHGHPDRLSLSLQDGATRLLEDPGAGSYVERTLHWYRSTLAHNAPLVNGRSQQRVAAQLDAFDARSGVGWMRVSASELSPGVHMQRTVVLLDTHLVDLFEWRADREVTVDLPLHTQSALRTPCEWRSADPGGGGGLEDGFNFLRDVECADIGPFETLEWHSNVLSSVRTWYTQSRHGSLWRAMAPGPPRTHDRQLYWLRGRGTEGSIVGLWSLRDSVMQMTLDHARSADGTDEAMLPLRLVLRCGTHVVHDTAPHGWHVSLEARGARSSLDLTGRTLRASPESDPSPHSQEPQQLQASRATPPHSPRSEEPQAAPLQPGPVKPRPILRNAVDGLLSAHEPLRIALGEAHYRRSEQSWREADRPTAEVILRATPATLEITVHAHTGPPVTPDEGAENHLDNERADINADGVQLYIGPPDRSPWSRSWLCVPAATGVRVTTLLPASPDISAQWSDSAAGWQMTLTVPREWLPLGPDAPFAFDVIVNERPAKRQRRRGQLVLSGGAGEFVYLRGDRHDPRRALLLQCVPSPAP